MKKSNRQKLTSIIISIVLLCIVFLAFMRYSHKIQANVDDYAETTLTEIVTLQKNSIHSRLTTDMNLLNNISALFVAKNFTFSQAVDFIQDANINPGFHQLVLVNVDGTAVSSDGSTADITFANVSSQFSSKEPTYFNPVFSAVNDNYILPMSYPVYDDERQEVRYLLVGLQTLDVLHSYSESTFDEKANVSVIDSTGELIFSSQLTQSNVGLRDRYLDILFASITAPITLDQLYTDLEAGQSSSFVYTYDDTEIFFQYVPLGINDWFVAVHLDKSSLASRIDLASQDAFGFLGTLCICLLLLAVYIYVIATRTKKELYHLAFFDRLTKLPNGEHFKLELDKILSKHPNDQFYCIVFDICGFKHINYRLGYAIGDQVLCSVSNVIKTAIVDKYQPSMAGFAKLHSDTFVILIPADSTEDCDRQMHSLVKRIQIATSFLKEHRIDFSLGRYTTQVNDTSETILERALYAHSRAKRLPPNQFIDFDDVFVNTLHTRADILNSFDEAIANNEFQLYFHPQFSSTTKELHGTEILVRWIKEDKVKYTPDVFIPILEETGRISKLDSFLREKLCIMIRDWLECDIQLTHFSVNVSRIELIQPDFLPRLQALLNKYHIPPAMIHIELTETAYTDNQDYMAEKIIELQSCGFLVEMDDFGSGYSSLNMLKDIHVDIVKLDMKLVEQGTLSARSSKILISIVQMAQSINLQTIAEGVETQEQVDYLERIGCNYLQGYFFARPMPADDYLEFLKNYNNTLRNETNKIQ